MLRNVKTGTRICVVMMQLWLKYRFIKCQATWRPPGWRGGPIHPTENTDTQPHDQVLLLELLSSPDRSTSTATRQRPFVTLQVTSGSRMVLKQVPCNPLVPYFRSIPNWQKQNKQHRKWAETKWNYCPNKQTNTHPTKRIFKMFRCFVQAGKWISRGAWRKMKKIRSYVHDCGWLYIPRIKTYIYIITRGFLGETNNE